MDELSKRLFKRLKKFFKKHPFDLLFLLLALIATSTSALLYLKSNQQLEQKLVEIQDQTLKNLSKLESQNQSARRIYVDISGAVLKPDVYVVSEGARIKDVLILAGGLSANADRNFFYRNFNLALPVFDGQKIYVPSYSETRRGIIREPKRVFDFTGYNSAPYRQFSSKSSRSFSKSSIVNINSASKEQLEALPGIGPVTAQKIIENRPYSSLDELLQKKILRKSVFEAIKDRLTL